MHVLKVYLKFYSHKKIHYESTKDIISEIISFDNIVNRFDTYQYSQQSLIVKSLKARFLKTIGQCIQWP